MPGGEAIHKTDSSYNSQMNRLHLQQNKEKFKRRLLSKHLEVVVISNGEEVQNMG